MKLFFFVFVSKFGGFRRAEKGRRLLHQLIGDVRVVLARHALADGRLHETRQRRQHVDGRVDLPVVQLPVHVDLALRDVARQVRNRVGDVCWIRFSSVRPAVTTYPSVAKGRIS